MNPPLGLAVKRTPRINIDNQKSVRTVDDRRVHAQMSALVERPYSLAETVDRD